jgi:FkbM family methyltransferase
MKRGQKLVYLAKHFIKSSNYRAIFFNWLSHQLRGGKNPELTIEAPGGATFVLSAWQNWTEYEFWKAHKILEEHSRVITAALAKSGNVCLDVGANIGLYSLFIAACGAKKVYSFEPAKGNFDRFLKNIARNLALSKKIVPIQKAISDTNQQLSVYFNEVCPGLTKVGVENNSSESCSAISLDEFCLNESLHHVDLLKIDVEGFEMHVMAGCKDLLKAHRIEVIFFESYDNALNEYGASRTEQWKFLDSYGYHIFSLKGTRLDLESFCQSDGPDFVSTYHDTYVV